MLLIVVVSVLYKDDPLLAVLVLGAAAAAAQQSEGAADELVEDAEHDVGEQASQDYATYNNEPDCPGGEVVHLVVNLVDNAWAGRS